MKIVEPSVTVLTQKSEYNILRRIEEIGRVCYKSEENITSNSCYSFVKKLIQRKHMAMLEHESISVKVICDRGISHEIVRHRISSFAQMSTRFCNFASGKFGSEISVICPFLPIDDYEPFIAWKNAVETAEKSYMEMIEEGVTPEIARSVLPTCLATEIVITMNIREWLHFFSLRLSSRAHPQMQEIARMILFDFQMKYPNIFGEIEEVQET